MPDLPPELQQHSFDSGPFGAGGDPTPTPQPETPPEPAEPTPAPPPDPERARLEQDLARERERLDRILAREPISEPTPSSVVPPLPQRPSGPMPNPAVDPEAFAERLEADAAWRNAVHDREIASLRFETQQQMVAAQLWNEIRTDDSTRGIAQFEDLWASAFQALGGRVVGDPREFKRRVTERVQSMVQAIRGGDGTAGQPGASAPVTPTAPRTAGLSGGSAPGTQASRPRASAQNGKVIDLVSEIEELQRNDPMGYIAC